MTWVHNASPEIDAQSQWPLIVGVCVGLTTLMTVTVSLRMYVRAWMIKSMGIDDWVMLSSCICSIIYNALCITQTRYGLGLDPKSRPDINANKYSEVNFAGRPFYMAGTTGFKVALCFAYLRITGSNTKPVYRRIIWSFTTFTILSHVGGTLVLLFQCTPMKRSWRPKLTPSSCLPNDITFYVLAAITIFCDLVIFALPIPLLAKLQINRRRKAGLIAVFSLGAFTTVCSIMRMVQISIITKSSNSTMLVLWGTIEMNVGIFLTCLPSLTPLFTFFANKAKTSGLYYGRTKGLHDSNSSNAMRLEKRASRFESSPSSSATTAVNRSSSEEHIIPIQGKGDLLITKTTEIDIQEYDNEHDAINRRAW
ncbi:hypothetical protein PMZ80_000967 [Knufia obscura]|uniref:Rhodopsin domain-containing protein n=1 Tax=Knufia obscura TaxID=1635080 RepID=A0ABR0S2V1_9EURO|nr:hypothetical protein PMZ80_000967 [Knufia obscura]